jgi:ribonuclease HI
MLPMDVEVILKIPISHRRQRDMWAWHYDRKGLFSVRSAYRMLVWTREKRDAWLEGCASSSNGIVEEKQWSSLWKTRVPSKVKLFTWRLAKHSLPTNDIRNHRGMADDDRCQFCGTADLWRHALLDCTLSRCVWALADPEVTEHLSASDEGEAWLWLANMFATLDHDKLTRVLITLWAIWHARQKAIYEQQFQSPLMTHLFMERFIDELRQSEERKPKNPVTNQTRVSPGWIPPPSGIVKINVDAAVGKSHGRGAVAAVARSDRGVYMGASAIVLLGNTDPETLEALACREGLALARDITARAVRVASDCKAVVDSIAEGTRGVYALIVQELLDAKPEFLSLSFCHDRRICNKEAHTLARSMVLDSPGRHVWLIDPPIGLCIPHVIEV